ncbi:hypothetical protein GUJ93_ZPchr0011g27573 [Zizania palustris]|nr:hypothetical protein GUJ93_ZPchr0011g27573 [Zizania palustris]
MFQNQARAERYNVSKSLFGRRLAEGSPVSSHVIRMIGYIKTLERLDTPLDPYLAIDDILQSLPLSFELFIMNYNMVGLEKTLVVLHGMLKKVEDSIRKSPNQVMLVQNDGKKRKRKGKAKTTDSIPNAKYIPAGMYKSGPAGSDVCYHYHKPGHWKHNCKVYLEE